MTSEESYLSRCIELAMLGLGNVAPNPMVGCVIVCDGKVIGEGYHKHFGEAHAEVNAINDVIERHGDRILENAHLYVSLEPCSHFGKTPPCTDLIITRKIPKVTIGCVDTFSEVNGSGIAKLKSAGAEVNTGILGNECRDLNKRFFTFHEKKRPYIILKWAQSTDNFIAPLNPTGENRKISNSFSHKRSHRWRSEEQAILVGARTVMTDNPRLTVREWPGKNPVRIVIDPHDTTPASASILDNTAPTILFSGNKNLKKGNTEWSALDFSGDVLTAVLAELHKRSLQSVIVEGGRITLQNFIDQDLWDEARIFISDCFINEGTAAPKIDFRKKVTEEPILNDRLVILRNR